MDWSGIGLLVIGIAFLVLVIFLIKPLNKLTNVLDSLQKTTDSLPNTMTDISKQATMVLHTGNDAIENVNTQVKDFQPLFQIVRDVGEASQQLTATALDKTMSLKQNTSAANEFAHRKQYEGLFGILSLFFYLSQKKKELKDALPKSK